LGRSETVPLPDQRFLDAASRVYGAGLTLETSEVLRIAKRYHPWQGYWAHYLRIAA
jgi:DNA-3-methyladenine glycosylase II